MVIYVCHEPGCTRYGERTTKVCEGQPSWFQSIINETLPVFKTAVHRPTKKDYS